MISNGSNFTPEDYSSYLNICRTANYCDVCGKEKRSNPDKPTPRSTWNYLSPEEQELLIIPNTLPHDESSIVKRYRELHPRSRVVSLIKLIINTSCRKQEGCILCGWKGPTWCAKYPETIRAYSAREEHIYEHLMDPFVYERYLI